MSTRSLIAAKFDANVDSDQAIVATYCHYDGYLSGVGLTLLKQYNDSERAFVAADSGYMSSLPGEFAKFDEEEHANSDDPEYFEDDWDFLHSLDNYSAEFGYLFKDGQWFYAVTKEVPQQGYEYTKPLNEVLKPLTYKAMLPELETAITYCRRAASDKNLSDDKRAEYEESIAEYEAMILLAESTEEVSH